ncbi:DHH family phosphoesterase [Namhaeicola litoreus]|uniref:Bifunctional oligoribonuclease/PAP phosphatase NrnA n=1 Tax=Namhaeicola litoreus TaxID=1052145 RepID=A0ABW3Y6T8_9FLAO
MHEKQIEEVKKLLADSRNIAIVSHRNPDGDAYGSCLALSHLLKKLGHHTTVVSPNDCPNFLKWMPGQNQIVIFEEQTEIAKEILQKADIVFTLDFNALNRVGPDMEKVLSDIDPVYIMIDHHQDPDQYAKYSYVDPNICSTSQLIYQWTIQMGWKNYLDKDISTCIYTGILTDTGSFRFSNTNGDTHRIVGDLLDLGVEHTQVYREIHENSISRLKLLGKALKNMVYLKEYRTAFITLKNYELKQCNYQKGDTEGFVNYALSLTNVVLAAIFIEDKQQNIIKISFRSTGDFNVNELARDHFNGGGHINAAGGRSDVNLKDTVDNFIAILPEYKDSLLACHE